VNAETSWVLSAADGFNEALPNGVEIVRAPTATLVNGGIIPETVTELTGALDLLSGAETVARRADGTLTVSLDTAAAVASVDPDVVETIGLSLDGVTGTVAVAEVELSDDGSWIEAFRIRIEGSRDGREWLVTGAIAVTEVTTDIDFDPPDPALVADLADVPGVERFLTR
jgi:hypothetical protein